MVDQELAKMIGEDNLQKQFAKTITFEQIVVKIVLAKVLKEVPEPVKKVKPALNDDTMASPALYVTMSSSYAVIALTLSM